MENWLIQFDMRHVYLVYILIVALAYAEGPIISMISGFLLKLGYLKLLPIYVAIMLGDLIGDVFWYWIGRRFGYQFVDKFGKYFAIDRDSIGKVEKIFHKYKNSILLFSKMTNGLGFSLVTIITAGMIRIPFSRFITLNIIGQFIWSGIMLSIGYFFGKLYLQVNDVLWKITVAGIFIIFFLLFMRYKKYISQKSKEFTNKSR